MTSAVPPPLSVICELTHRCPLACAYCSNPRELVPAREELDTAHWQRAMAEAAALGVLQVHLTGGEPLLRSDLGEIARAAAASDLYPMLITSGIGPRAIARLEAGVQEGIRAVQVSFQDTVADAAQAVAGSHLLEDKIRFARRVRDLGASLTTNFVLHRKNLERLGSFIELSLSLGADRVELAHVQYHGWALLNRARLIPTPEQIEAAARQVAIARTRHRADIDIVYAMPDHFAGRPRPCMSGWGRRAIVIDPVGRLLPCHGAATLPLPLENLRERTLAAAWYHGEAFRAFRGESWMEEPCCTCPERTRDFGGCRCQALAQTGVVTATDPACARSGDHEQIVALRRRRAREAGPLVLRSRTTT